MKKRRDFDIEYEKEINLINQMSLEQINCFRESKKDLLKKIETWIKEENITEGRKKFLKGWRKKEVNLLSYSKKREKQINIVIHNEITIDFSRRFVKTASHVLSQDLFQKIYGLSLIETDGEKTEIEEIKDFINECKIRLDKDGNNNEKRTSRND